MGKTTLLPLYNRLYSQSCPEFRSENEEIKEAIEAVCAQTQGRGVWVLDRGGDRQKLLWYLVKNKHRFLVRLRQDRHLICQGRQMSVLEIAQACPMLYQETVVKRRERPGEGPENRVRLPDGLPSRSGCSAGAGRGQRFWTRAADASDQSPDQEDAEELMVGGGELHHPLENRRDDPLHQTMLSVGRHPTADLFRLQNMMALVMAVAYFTMAYLGLRTKLRVLAGHVLRAARRIFGIPEFRFYALADGIKEHLFGQKRGIQGYFSAHTPESGQRLLFFP